MQGNLQTWTYLNINNISTLVAFHVCGQRNWAILFERPTKHVAGPSSVTFRVRHLSSEKVKYGT